MKKDKCNQNLDKAKLFNYLFFIISLHIFILPNDILDKFPFLVSYVEFMKEIFPFIYQISLRISNIPQVGILYASNMVLVAILFFVYCIPLSCYEIQYGNHDIGIKLRQEKLLFIIFFAILYFIFATYALDGMNSGGLFDTNLRDSPSSNNINSEFGLFFRVALFYYSIAFCYANVVVIISLLIKTLYKRIKNLI